MHAQNQGKLATVCLQRFSSIFESTIHLPVCCSKWRYDTCQKENNKGIGVAPNTQLRMCVMKILTFLTPFRLEKCSVRKLILEGFSMGFWMESGKIYNINDQTCLFHCINTCRV